MPKVYDSAGIRIQNVCFCQDVMQTYGIHSSQAMAGRFPCVCVYIYIYIYVYVYIAHLFKNIFLYCHARF
jgi:hypothetical protein